MSANSRRDYLAKRDNGYYYIGYLHEGKKRRKSTRSGTKQEALDALRALKGS